MSCQGATLSASFGDIPRSFCLRFHLGLFFPIRLLICSIVVLQSVSQKVPPTSLRFDDDQHWLSHPRAPSLCASTFSGLEGTPIKGFALDRVFIVTTPGLTFHQNVDSLLSLNRRSTSHCHFHKFAKTHSSQKIKSYSEALWMKDKVFEKYRPGSDFKLFKHVPHSIRCKDDMLTPQGVAQGVYLGEYLAKSYLNSLGTLSPSAFNTKGLAYSVGDELLYQNVHAILFGLLAEKQFMYADVEKLSHHFTDDQTSKDQTQEHLDHFMKTSFKNEHHLFKDDSSPTGNRWVIDSEFGREMSAKEILSSISFKECEKPAKDGIHLSSNLIESILSLSDVHNMYLLNSSIFLNYSKSMSLPFRKFLNSWISSPHKEKDFKLVSVGELFMLSLLNAFGVESIEHIPPVSRLVIEQFHFQSSSPSHLKRNSTSTSRLDLLSSSSSFVSSPTQMSSRFKVQNQNDYQSENNILDLRNVYFRVLYNGKVITNDIIHCRSDPLVSLGLCRMPSFVISLMSVEAIQFKEEL